MLLWAFDSTPLSSLARKHPQSRRMLFKTGKPKAPKAPSTIFFWGGQKTWIRDCIGYLDHKTQNPFKMSSELWAKTYMRVRKARPRETHLTQEKLVYTIWPIIIKTNRSWFALGGVAWVVWTVAQCCCIIEKGIPCSIPTPSLLRARCVCWQKKKKKT